MAPIFDSTFGIPVYQEQLMRAAVELAGYTPSESDELRSAISKKKKEAIEKHRKKFVEGAVKQGMERSTAQGIFADWEEFAALRLQQEPRGRLRRDRGADRVPEGQLRGRVHGGTAFGLGGPDRKGGAVCGGRAAAWACRCCRPM